MFNIDQIVKALQTDPNTQRTAMTGAAGLAAGMLLSRRRPGKLAGNAAKIGAVAAVGGLAYSAWQNYQNNQQRCRGAAPAQDAFIPAAGDTPRPGRTRQDPGSRHDRRRQGRWPHRRRRKGSHFRQARDHDAVRRGKGLGVRRAVHPARHQRRRRPRRYARACQPKSTPHRWSPSPPIPPPSAPISMPWPASSSSHPALVTEIHKAAGEKAPEPLPAPAAPFAYTPSASNV